MKIFIASFFQALPLVLFLLYLPLGCCFLLAPSYSPIGAALDAGTNLFSLVLLIFNLSFYAFIHFFRKKISKDPMRVLAAYAGATLMTGLLFWYWSHVIVPLTHWCDPLIGC